MTVDDNVHRLFVSNVAANVDINDLKNIFQKFCAVDSVYIPPPTVTGIMRGFAIVCINYVGDMNKILKAINGCYVKGCKIRLEKARKEFYLDRIRNEKLCSNEIPKVTENEVNTQARTSCDIFKCSSIKIKRQNVPESLEISVIPSATNRSISLPSCFHSHFDDEANEAEIPSASLFPSILQSDLGDARNGRCGFGTLLEENWTPPRDFEMHTFPDSENFCCDSSLELPGDTFSEVICFDRDEPFDVRDVADIKAYRSVIINENSNAKSIIRVLRCNQQQNNINRTLGSTHPSSSPSFDSSDTSVKSVDRNITDKHSKAHNSSELTMNQFTNLSSLKEIFYKEV